MDQDIINNLQKFVEDEEYDTESVIMDVASSDQKGNISTVIQDQEGVEAMARFIASSPCMLYLFL